MSSTRYAIVFNTSEAAIPYDEEGRQVFPGEWATVQRSKVKDHISEGRLVLVDPETIGDDSNITVKALKDQYDKQTAEWEASKEGGEEQAKASAPKQSSKASGDYDDSKSAAKSPKNN
jgi:hypothetical protein